MLDRNMEKSAGYAFVEFRKHQISQGFMGYIMNNPKMVMNHLFVIEYAIQDSKAILKLKNKNKKQRRNQLLGQKQETGK